MELFGNILAGSSILGLIYQDMKFRKVSWILLVLLSIGFLLTGLDPGISFKNIGLNFLFVVLQLLVLSFWSWWRWGGPFIFFDKALGLGDILFFLAMCFYFQPIHFILFHTLALIFSLLAFLVWAFIKKKSLSKTEFPLISGMGAVLFIVIITHSILNLEP